MTYIVDISSSPLLKSLKSAHTHETEHNYTGHELAKKNPKNVNFFIKRSKPSDVTHSKPKKNKKT